MRDATLAALCRGDTAPFRTIEARLIIGDRVGAIDDGVRKCPSRLISPWQKRTRLAPRRLRRRSRSTCAASGLLKSTLLHRLALIKLHGPADRCAIRRARFARSGAGVAAEYSVRLAEALVYGPTIEQAAAARRWPRPRPKCRSRASPIWCGAACLPICRMRQSVHRPSPGCRVNAADLAGLAQAVPPLVSILRYGTARKIPESALGALARTLAIEVITGAAVASRNLDAEAAERMRAAFAAFDFGAWTPGR